MERWWAYRIASPQACSDAVIAMDAFRENLVAGLGVIAKGYEGDPELLYVFVNANDPTDDEVVQIEAVMSSYGEKTALTYDELMVRDPRPHLVVSGPISSIVSALRTSYPGQVLARRSH